MTLSQDQTNQIKEHLLKTVVNFPEDRREQIEEQINAMNSDEIEDFIKKNKLTHLGNQCIFCSIISGKVESVKLDEDSQNLAILDINPLSEGHTLIVPKDHLKELLPSSKALSQRVQNKLKNKFNLKEIRINETEVMGHPIVEIIPVYDEGMERKSVTLDELKKLREEINNIDEPKKEPIKVIQEIIDEPLYKMPPRIP